MSTGSDAAEAAPPPIPYSYLVARLAIVIPMLLLVAFVAAGFAGSGPGHELVDLTHKALHWIDSVTELHWT